MPILRAGLGAPLGAVEHGRGDAADGGAVPHRAAEIGPGLDAQPLEHLVVLVERVAGQEEADRLVLLLQPHDGGPRLAERDAQRDVGVGDAAEHVGDAAGIAALGRALGQAIMASSAAQARARSGSSSSSAPAAIEVLQRALVDDARVHAPGEVGEVLEGRVAARLDEALAPPAGRRP